MRIRKGQLSLLIIDALIISFSFYAAFWLRDNGIIPRKEIILYFKFLPSLILGYIMFFYFFGLYKKIWDFVGLKALSSIFFAVILGSIVIPVLEFFIRKFYYPRSIIIIGGFLVFFFVCISRFSWRILREIIYPILKKGKGKTSYERAEGSFIRSFDVAGADADKIDASLKDGVLRIILPKLENFKPKQIEIK